MIFIRIKVKGYLKNITDNDVLFFEENAIMNKDKIVYSNNDVKTTIKVNDTEIILIREGNDFVNTFCFNMKKSTCNYLLKENNYDFDIEVKTIDMNINENMIYIKYLIVDSDIEFEYKLDIIDI